MDTHFLDANQFRFLKFVQKQHGDQTRKYTGDPYWYHLLNVANLLYSDDKRHLVVTGLAHDLYEDTDTTPSQLYNAIISCGYGSAYAVLVHTQVTELTDVYTSKAFPNLNRAQRKELEATRLGYTSIAAQNVKLADMCDNSSSILEHDPSFAEVYLKEKQNILSEISFSSVSKQLYKLCKELTHPS